MGALDMGRIIIMCPVIEQEEYILLTLHESISQNKWGSTLQKLATNTNTKTNTGYP